MSFGGYENKETCAVIREIENDQVVEFLINLEGNMENYGDTDLINTLKEIFESDTTPDGNEIGLIDCNEVRSFLDEL